MRPFKIDNKRVLKVLEKQYSQEVSEALKETMKFSDYSTSITDDVLGYLSEQDVTALLIQIEALPNAEDYHHDDENV